MELAGESIAQTPHARTIHLTEQPKEKIIPPTRTAAAGWPTSDRNSGRLRIGTGGRLQLECMAGFIGIRTLANSATAFYWDLTVLSPIGVLLPE